MIKASRLAGILSRSPRSSFFGDVFGFELDGICSNLGDFVVSICDVVLHVSRSL